MPEDSRKHQPKTKHEAKEQRKPRQSRQQAAPEKKFERKAEDPKVPAISKPVYEDPGPEFYNSLKRETDEILKITEEANSKYKKKEIQSNWSKYEMPIDSYEEMEEQENLGADYEKLIQAPQSIGGHFQFKHEKTWDLSTAPSLYDKYFEINMESLATALSTIPFCERNNMEKTIFSDIDILNMNNRATKYKQKYYNDKSYTTPELDAQDKIVQSLKGGYNKSDDNTESIDNLSEEKISESKDIVFDDTMNISKTEAGSKKNESSAEIKVGTKLIESKNLIENTTTLEAKLSNQEDTILEANEKVKPDIEDTILEANDLIIDTVGTSVKSAPVKGEKDIKLAPAVKEVNEESSPKKTKKPVIESPEDLEKWLDDFLDG